MPIENIAEQNKTILEMYGLSYEYYYEEREEKEEK